MLKINSNNAAVEFVTTVLPCTGRESPRPNWSVWKQEFNNYVVASSIDSLQDPYEKAILFYYIGSEIFKTACQVRGDTNTYDEELVNLKNYYKSKTKTAVAMSKSCLQYFTAVRVNMTQRLTMLFCYICKYTLAVSKSTL